MTRLQTFVIHTQRTTHHGRRVSLLDREVLRAAAAVVVRVAAVGVARRRRTSIRVMGIVRGRSQAQATSTSHSNRARRPRRPAVNNTQQTTHHYPRVSLLDREVLRAAAAVV